MRGLYFPGKEKCFLMDYIDALHSLPTADSEQAGVPGKTFFAQLNRVRVDVKHHGLFPDPKQWARVGEFAYGYVSEWCSRYLGTSLDDLDESSLLNDPGVKAHYDRAREAAPEGNYRETLEELARGLIILFEKSAALRGLVVGKPSAEDAIKLLGFGVHARDFLRLQEFLPEVSGSGVEVRWKQNEFGHPANWRGDSASFCLRSFLDVALKLQDAAWIPGAVPFGLIYDHKFTAVREGVEIWTDVPVREVGGPILGPYLGPTRREIVKILRAGESLRGVARLVPGTGLFGLGSLLGCDEPPEPSDKTIEIYGGLVDGGVSGFVRFSDVKVTCVPKDSDWVRKHFGELSEVDWQPN